MHFWVHILHVSWFSWLFVWFCSNRFCWLGLRSNILVLLRLDIRNIRDLHWRLCLTLRSRTSFNLLDPGRIGLFFPRAVHLRISNFGIAQIGFRLTWTEIFYFLNVTNLLGYFIPLLKLIWWFLNLREVFQVNRQNIWHLRWNIVSLIKIASFTIAMRLILRSGRKERFIDILSLNLIGFCYVFLNSQRCWFRGKHTLFERCNWWTLP